GRVQAADAAAHRAQGRRLAAHAAVPGLAAGPRRRQRGDRRGRGRGRARPAGDPPSAQHRRRVPQPVGRAAVRRPAAAVVRADRGAGAGARRVRLHPGQRRPARRRRVRRGGRPRGPRAGREGARVMGTTDHGHPLRFGLAAPTGDPQAAVELARLTEELGLDVVAVRDEPDGPDAWTLLSWIAGETNGVWLALDGLDLVRRPASVAARAAASLDLLSGGRVEVGLAPDGADEAIDILRALWASDPTPVT